MRISLIGTGLMGFAIAKRLLAKNQEVAVYNRSSEKAEALAQFKARVCTSIKEVVDFSDTIILTLSDFKAIESVLKDCSVSLKNKNIIQMGTISPSESKTLAEFVDSNDAVYAECPVLGSRGEAESGRLILMMAGDKSFFDKYVELFQMLGKDPQYIGEVGQASALKLALNQLIAAHAFTFSASLGIIQQNNIDVNIFKNILKESALYAPMFDKKLDNWLSHDYDNPNFPTKHLLKDALLIKEEAQRLGLSIKVIESMCNEIQRAVDAGFGEKDYSSIFEVVLNKGKKE